MKNCQTCGNQNSDEMRFCLNCGGALPDAPIVVNFGQGTGSSSPGTNPYGQPTPSNPGSAPGTNPWGQQPQQPQQPPPQFGQQAPQYGQTPPPPQQNYSMVPPAKGGGGSGKKIFIAVAGVFALFFLVVIAVVGIVGYNMYKSEQARLASTPTPSPSASTKPSASPSASKSASPSPSASASPAEKTVLSDYAKVKINFKKVWVDYNVTEGDEMGMTVHVKYDVTKMKGIDSFAVIYFQKDDGGYLDNGTGTTKAKDGRVAVFKPLKPGFEPTAYEDLQIFVPYDALNLEPGNYKLKMDIDMIDLDENLVGHITFKDFEYEQK